MAKLRDGELTAILAAEKADALSSADSAKLTSERARAMNYYNGDVSADLPSIADRSRAVSYDVSDTVEGLMPSLMDIFASGDEVVKFTPASAEDEDAAAQETAYINHVYSEKNPGFINTYSFVKDALLSKNGILKIWWEVKTDEERETVYDQTEDAYAVALADETLEIIEHTVHPPKPPEMLSPSSPGGAGMMAEGGFPLPPGLPGEAGGPGLMPPMSPDIGAGPYAGGPMPAGPEAGPSLPPEPPMPAGLPPEGMLPPEAVPPGPAPMPELPQAGAPPVPMPSLAGTPGPLPGQVEPGGYGPTHDFTTVRSRTYGCCRIEPVPPEEFGVGRNAKLGQPLDYCYHEVLRTQASLLKAGFDEEQIEGLPSAARSSNSEVTARDTVDDASGGGLNDLNRANRLISITEHYCILDYEQDGKPALYRVTTGGEGASESVVLKREGKADIERVDFPPFAVITPIIVTHRFFGKSVADLVIDIMRIKTSLTRSLLDNAYLANNQRLEIAESHAHPKTLDDVLDNRIGGIIRTKQPGGIVPIPNQEIGSFVFPMIEYLDATREWRTGVTRQGQGLDPDALKNIGEQAVLKAQSAAYEKTKLIARIFAETGFKEAFWKIHATVRKHETNQPTVRLLGDWVTVDPKQWRKRDDMTVSVGGGGSKVEQLAFWGQVVVSQNEALDKGSGLCTPEQVYNSLKKLMELGGEKAVERYWTNPAEAPPQEPEPSPEELKVQAQMQLEQQKAQLNAQTEQAKMQAQQQMDQAKMQAEMQMEQAKLQRDAQLEQAKMVRQAQIEERQAQADLAVQKLKVEAEIALERERFALERELKLIDARIRAQEFERDQAAAAQQDSRDAEGHKRKMREAFPEQINFEQTQETERESKVAEALQALAASLAAPKRIRRGPDGRAEGIEVAPTNGAG